MPAVPGRAAAPGRGLKGGRPASDPGENPLRLLPSGPDRVGEEPVRASPPPLTIGLRRPKRNPRPTGTPLRHGAAPTGGLRRVTLLAVAGRSPSLRDAVDVGAWLEDLGLERYEQAFRTNAVDARSLPHLTADDLKSWG